MNQDLVLAQLLEEIEPCSIGRADRVGSKKLLAFSEPEHLGRVMRLFPSKQDHTICEIHISLFDDKTFHKTKLRFGHR